MPEAFRPAQPYHWQQALQKFPPYLYTATTARGKTVYSQLRRSSHRTGFSFSQHFHGNDNKRRVVRKASSASLRVSASHGSSRLSLLKGAAKRFGSTQRNGIRVASGALFISRADSVSLTLRSWGPSHGAHATKDSSSSSPFFSVWRVPTLGDWL